MLTIQQIIDSITATVPGAPFKETVDTVKCGDPAQDVTGIVTTFLATTAVIRRAIELGANFIISHEAPFYQHHDEIEDRVNDPVFVAKRELLESSGIVIWRFHDLWHRHQPDGILTGTIRTLGWEALVTPDNPYFVTLEAPQPLDAVAAHVKARLGAACVRVVGPADLECRTVAVLPGFPGNNPQMDVLAGPVDAVIVGEGHEWETPEYVRDALAHGFNKAMIVLGHAISEEAGMAYLVEWLEPHCPGVPVTHVPTTDPFRWV